MAHRRRRGKRGHSPRREGETPAFDLLEPRLLLAGIDYIVQNVSPNGAVHPLPDPVYTDSTIWVFVSTKNNGDANAPGYPGTDPKSYTRAYASPDPTITGSGNDIYLGETPIDPLPAQGPANRYIEVNLATTGISPGTYYIGAIADATGIVSESNELNNGAVCPTPIVSIIAHQPDYVIANVTPDGPLHPLPSPVLTNSTIWVFVSTLNSGSGNAPGYPGTEPKSYTRAYASPDQTITGSGNDIYLGEVAIDPLPSQGPANRYIPVNLATTGISAGTYYIGAVADATGIVSESNELNNAATWPGTLSIQQLTETESNNSIATADWLPRNGAIGGIIPAANEDIDYFDLGTLERSQVIWLRLATTGSDRKPWMILADDEGHYWAEDHWYNDEPEDPELLVAIPQTDHYYVMVASNWSGFSYELSFDDYGVGADPYPMRQVIYLDFDGASATPWGNLPAFDAGQLGFPGQGAEMIAEIVSNMALDLASYGGICFTMTEPLENLYSTVYLSGGSNTEYNGYAEDTDPLNHLCTDRAVVWAGNMASVGGSLTERAMAISNVAIHETGHLLGLSHCFDQHDIMYPSWIDILENKEFRASQIFVYWTGADFVQDSPYYLETVFGPASPPDYVIANVTPDGPLHPLPTPVDTNSTIWVFASTQNSGSGDAPGYPGTTPKSYTKAYASPDQTITGSGNDIYLGEVAIDPLPAQGPANRYIQVNLGDTDITPGLYYIGAIADATGIVSESNELNNGAVWTGGPLSGRVNVDQRLDEWTVIAYVDGDNNLEWAYDRNIAEMQGADPSDDINLLVLFDRGPGSDIPGSDTSAYLVDRGGSKTNIPLSDIHSGWISEVNMGDPATLRYFADYAIGHYPAQKCMLILQDHGGSWTGVCQDVTSGDDWLQMPELRTALSDITAHLGGPLDLLWFNGCLMSSAEVIAEITTFASQVVASETISYTEDADYGYILNEMGANPGMSPVQLAELIANRTARFWPSGEPKRRNWVGLDIDGGAVRLNGAVSALATQLRANWGPSESRAAIIEARGASETIEGPRWAGEWNSLIDLFSFTEHVQSNGTLGVALRNAAQEVMTSIDQIVTTGPPNPDLGGISIYFPEQPTMYQGGYDNTVTLVLNTEWNEFLVDYFGGEWPPGSIPLPPPGEWFVELDPAGDAWVGAGMPLDEVDYYRIYPDRPGNVTFTARPQSGSSVQPRIGVYGSGGEKLLADASGGPVVLSVAEHTAHWARIDGGTTSGLYAFTVDAPAPGVVPLDLDTQGDAMEPVQVEGEGDADYFSLTALGSGLAEAWTEGILDTVLTVYTYDGSGFTAITRNDTGGGPNPQNARVSWSAVEGTVYYLRLGQNSPDDLGATSLRINSPPVSTTVTLTTPVPNAAEPSTNGTYRISRTGPTTSALTVNFDPPTGDATRGMDYRVKKGTTEITGNSVTIDADQGYVDVMLEVIDDCVDEGASETATLTLASGTDYTVGTPNSASISIADDDTAGFTVTPTSGLVTTEGGGSATFTVQLNSQPTANVTIGLSSSDTTEGTVSPTSLTFTSANWSTPQTVTVTGVDDPDVDGNIPYSIVAAAATSSDTKYNGLNPPDVSVTNNDDDTRPRVTQVLLCGSAWNASFLNYLQDHGLGDGGYPIPVGSGVQLKPLPWTTADRIRIVFSEDVLVDMGDLRLDGVNVVSYGVDFFSYDAGTFTGTWTLSAPIGADKLLIELNADGPDPIRDAGGNALDGDWDNPTGTGDPSSDTYPSGDGSAGGNFQFRFNVLPGDANQNEYVQASDGLLVRGALGASTTGGNYSIFKDVNANGYIQASDGLLVRGRLGGSLPPGEPSASGFDALTAGGFDGLTTGGFDALTAGGFDALTTSGFDALTAGEVLPLSLDAGGTTGAGGSCVRGTLQAGRLTGSALASVQDILSLLLHPADAGKPAVCPAAASADQESLAPPETFARAEDLGSETLAAHGAGPVSEITSRSAMPAAWIGPAPRGWEGLALPIDLQDNLLDALAVPALGVLPAGPAR